MGCFFVSRPIFAIIISIVGMVSYTRLPVAQYPEIAPPSIVVLANYPGADAKTVAETVATPLEQKINGVEGMIYFSSYSTSDGSVAVTITFELGTDLDAAQVPVQNRVSIAEPRLPQEVRSLGVTTTKSSPDLMMVVHMLSPDESLDQLYVSNYTKSRVRDQLIRLDGVGDITIFGEGEFSARVWFDPDRLALLGLTASDVVNALREQNVQVSGGSLGAPPNNADNAIQVTVTTQGRLEDPKEFGRVIVTASDDGRVVRVRDVAWVEMGARSYANNSYLNGVPAVGLGIFQRPGSNALATGQEIIDTMDELATDFPPGLEYRIVYNPTEFIEASINSVYQTIFEVMVLVIAVILIFLQSWRTAIIPLLAIPVSLVGTFAIILALGYSLNLLTLFGLILAIGIVVDDAIVVVENVERNIDNGMTPFKASQRTMDGVQGAIIGTSLVLIAVFIPSAFVPGITGQFYAQFAVTISVATIISTINSLSLSPALAGVLLKSCDAKPSTNPLARIGGALSDGFNRAFDTLSNACGRLVAFAGFFGATFTVASNQGVIFTPFDSFEDRLEADPPAHKIVGALFGRMQVLQKAFIIAIAPPSVRGVGNGGGFKLMLKDSESADMSRVLNTSYAVMGTAAQSDKLQGVFTSFTQGSPQVYLEIDRVRAQIL